VQCECEPDRPKRRIWFECSRTYFEGGTTGVQRVVRNLINESLQSRSPSEWWLTPVVFSEDGIHVIDRIDASSQDPPPRRLSWSARVGRYYANILRSSLTVRRCTERFGNVLPLVALRNWLARWCDDPYTRRQRDRLGPIADFNAGDVLVLSELLWYLDVWPAIDEARARGVTIVTIVHDLIPLTHSSYYYPSKLPKVRAWLLAAADRSDGFLTVSNTVKRELMDFYGRETALSAESAGRFGSFRLGASFDEGLVDSSGREAASVVVEFHRRVKELYLVVGTIGPRKNQLYALRAFQTLWDEGLDVGLCFIGTCGCFHEQTTAAITGHPLLGERLFWKTDASDVDLRFLYYHSRALILCSTVEGFGLPIVEALQKRLPVFASDIPVFHEVGGDAIRYFDVHDPSSLAAILRQTHGHPLPTVEPSDVVLSWKESAEQFKARVLELAVAAERRRSAENG